MRGDKVGILAESTSGRTDGSVRGDEAPIGSDGQLLRSQWCAQLQILGLHSLGRLAFTDMEPNICVDLTPRRKLNFCSNDENKEKEVVPLEDNGEEKVIGFGIRKHSMHKDASGRIIDRIFCCACQGRRAKDKRDVSVKSHRPETRTGCCAMMRINGRYTRNYKVVNFIADHKGHDLVSPSKTHFLRSHRRITDVQAQQTDDISSSEIAPKAGYYLMLKQVGGRENVGFIFEDYKNYLRSKRTMEMKIGDTGGVLEYLQQKQLVNPNFFYAIQVDEDDLIANIIWVDEQMMVDYSYFGYVVTFDTTYRKKRGVDRLLFLLV
ncbi:UNVERIFIED_CONTAM: protein FAR-RED ELONGATED HYPOCOTYL 3 [Sesamum angustifolium]|uniref:Protein FAR-RED ELONGATED HYPOCOTYL 3 n=1 Tax=Sesamum angustifolium TaxID=2727405 RepID=A0AAW2IQW8_9LAMI